MPDSMGLLLEPSCRLLAKRFDIDVAVHEVWSDQRPYYVKSLQQLHQNRETHSNSPDQDDILFQRAVNNIPSMHDSMNLPDFRPDLQERLHH